ncbi:MAG: DUF3488 domain-containing protein [Phycisphaerales bacterium]|nr:DUF3488 domain-containing protein [Phycisphaerales bacterium]
MTLATRFNISACAAVLVGSLTFCLADDRPILAIIIVPIIIIGWVCGMGERGERTDPRHHPIALPRLLVNLLVVAAIINAAMRAGGSRTVGQPIVSHLGEFLIYVQLLKLFDRRTVRDESQLLTLSVFVIIAAVLTSNNLLTGVGIVLYTPLAISATMLYQLRAGQARAAEFRPASAAAREQGHPDLNRTFTRQLVQTVWLCVLTAGFLGAIVFIVTPRGLGVGALGQFGQPHAMVGFNDHIDLRRSGLLSESSMPVIDLALEDESGANIGSPYRMVYLRGFTREEYNNRVWVRSKTAPTTLTFRPGTTTVLPVPNHDRGSENEPEPAPTAKLVQRITIRPTVSSDSYIFGAWRPTAVQTNDTTSGTLTYDLLDGSIKRPKSAHIAFTYTIESSEIQTKSDLPPEFALGFQDGPVHDLAWSILRARQSKWPEDDSASGIRSVANAFRDYLGKNFTYTLDLWAPDEDRDPLDMFLFEKRTGHCQYFASAMTAMLQAVGIHARIVGGFVAADYNSLTGTYIVRQSNAHAWVEVHTGGGIWTRYDPTPTADLDRIHRAPGGWFSAVRRWWDTLEFGWNRSIVSFDTDRLGASAGRGEPSSISAWFVRIADRLARGVSVRDLRSMLPPWAFYIVPATMLIVTLAIVTGRLSRSRLARLVRRHPRERDPQLRALLNDAGFYGQALRALERRGGPFAKPDDRPPLAHAAVIERIDPIVADPFRSIASTYYEARFGRVLLTHEQVSAGRDALSRLKDALNRSAATSGDACS